MDIGHFAVCQSRNDETKFKFRTQIAHQNVQICLIPTYREGSSSTYLGRAQCTFTQAGKDYEGRLYKDRNGFSHRALNGVIVLKYGLHNSYFRCMNASLGWPGSACSNGPYTNQQCYQHFATCPQGSATPGNNNCAALANAHMVNVCEDFKRTYSSSYADISTR